MGTEGEGRKKCRREKAIDKKGTGKAKFRCLVWIKGGEMSVVRRL